MRIKSTAEVYSNMNNLVENWGDRISIVEQVSGDNLPYDKKIVLAQCLENTQQAINMMEATDSGSTDGFKRFALDLVTAIVPNLVANDIVSVQPISNEVGVINYIRYLYGNTKGAAKKGEEFASGILYTGSDFYYSSEEVVGEGLTVTPGTGSAGTITGVLAWKPIVKGTVKIPVQYKNGADSVMGYVVDTPKDGTLALTDPLGKPVDGVLGASTIKYDTGAISIAFTGTAELEANSTTLANYRYNNKSIGDGAIGTNALTVPEVDIKIETMPVICQSRKLKALYAFDAAFKLTKEYGTDINALLNSQIASEIAHEIDGEIMDDLLKGAGLVNDTWDEANLPSRGISLRDHYDSFNMIINKGSNKIFQETKRATANFMIVGIDVATVVESMTTFVPSGVKNVIGPHVCGTIGNTSIIKNPYYPSKSYLLGYKGASLFDAGYYYCPYMPITTTQLVMLDDFVGRKGWATSYAKKMVQPLLYCRGEIIDSSATTIKP